MHDDGAAGAVEAFDNYIGCAISREGETCEGGFEDWRNADVVYAVLSVEDAV